MGARIFVNIFFLFVVSHLCSGQPKFTLDECIEHALAHSRDIRLSDLHAADAQADLKAQVYMRLPSVQANINNALNASYEQGYDSDGEVDYIRANRYTNHAIVQLSAPIWTEETDHNLTKAYKLNSEEAKAEREYKKMQVKLEVLDKYFSVALAQIRHKIAQEQSLLQDSTLYVTQNLFSIGRKAKKDVIDAQLNLEQDKHSERIELDNVELAISALAYAMRFDGPLQIDTAHHWSDPLFSPSDVSPAIERHPYVNMETLNAEMTERERKNIKRGRFPSVALNAECGTSAYRNIEDESPDMEDQWKHNAYGKVGIDIQLPIFSHLDTKTKLQKNNVKREQYKENIAKAKDMVRYEIESTLSEIKQNQESVNRLQNLTVLAKKEYQMALADYKLGNIASYELNVYKTKYISATLQLAQAKCQLEYKNAKLKIYSE